MTKQFQIVASIPFALPKAIASAFNSHHKTRLTKLGGGMAQVSEEGAKFFTARARLTNEALSESMKAEGFTPLANWYYKNGVAYPLGSGLSGQSAFAWALSELTQQASKALARAKAKPESKTKASTKAKQEKPAKAIPASLPVKPAIEASVTA